MLETTICCLAGTDDRLVRVWPGGDAHLADWITFRTYPDGDFAPWDWTPGFFANRGPAELSQYRLAARKALTAS